MNTTTENNKIIADFMNCENPQAWEDDLYRYDWNWLMEVVEKCYNTKESYNLHKNIEDAFIYKVDNRIEAVYLTVVEFIKSYNETK